MNEEFLARAIPIFDQAVIDGETPVSWTMTKALFENLRLRDGWWREAQKVCMGSRWEEGLAGIPVDVTVGAHYDWTLCCESGARYEERGRR